MIKGFPKIWQVTLVFLLPWQACTVMSLDAQHCLLMSAEQPSALTFRSSTNLVLVDVIALNARTGAPDKTLKQEEFRIFDNGHIVPIRTFDRELQSRPLALWLVVQCKMPDWEKQGSGLFAGREHLFEPALKSLDKRDTVAVSEPKNIRLRYRSGYVPLPTGDR